jgi:hypothetical protein
MSQSDTKYFKQGDQVRIKKGRRPFTPGQRQTLWIVQSVSWGAAWIGRIEDQDSLIEVHLSDIEEATVLDLLGDV